MMCRAQKLEVERPSTFTISRERKFYARAHVKITRLWKSTLRTAHIFL